jgi:hypothetical protein
LGVVEVEGLILEEVLMAVRVEAVRVVSVLEQGCLLPLVPSTQSQLVLVEQQ